LNRDEDGNPIIVINNVNEGTAQQDAWIAATCSNNLENHNIPVKSRLQESSSDYEMLSNKGSTPVEDEQCDSQQSTDIPNVVLRDFETIQISDTTRKTAF